MAEPLLRRGSGHYDEVRELQEFLNANGADIEVDGDFGPKTEAAVRAFQEQNGLTADGVVGPQTREAMADAGATGETVPVPLAKPGPRESGGPAYIRQMAEQSVEPLVAEIDGGAGPDGSFNFETRSPADAIADVLDSSGATARRRLGNTAFDNGAAFAEAMQPHATRVPDEEIIPTGKAGPGDTYNLGTRTLDEQMDASFADTGFAAKDRMGLTNYRNAQAFSDAMTPRSSRVPAEPVDELAMFGLPPAGFIGEPETNIGIPVGTMDPRNKKAGPFAKAARR